MTSAMVGRTGRYWEPQVYFSCVLCRNDEVLTAAMPRLLLEKSVEMSLRDAEIRGTFQDLLLRARRMYYPNRISLCYEELYAFERKNDFFSWMDGCYEQLNELPITVRISDVDEQLARGMYWEEIAEMADLEKAYADVDWDALELDQQRSKGEQERAWARENQRLHDWARSFPEPLFFWQCYLRLREQYSDAKMQDTPPQVVEQALDAFLQERSGSYFLDNTVFFSANKLLDDAAEQLNKLLQTRPSEHI